MKGIQCVYRRQGTPWDGKQIGKAAGVGGALLLGVGMSLCMVFEKIVPGIVVGVGGIALLLLIPLTKGLK